MGEIFPYQDGFVVLRAHWPEATSTHAATFVRSSILRKKHKGRGPYYAWLLQDDDRAELHAEWAAWLEARDKPGATREDARQYAERCLDIKLEAAP